VSNHLWVVVANEYRNYIDCLSTRLDKILVGCFYAQNRVCHPSQYINHKPVTSTNSQPPPNGTGSLKYVTHSLRLNIYIYTHGWPPHPPSLLSRGVAVGAVYSLYIVCDSWGVSAPISVGEGTGPAYRNRTSKAPMARGAWRSVNGPEFGYSGGRRGNRSPAISYRPERT
jgi:hypothetical protein